MQREKGWFEECFGHLEWSKLTWKEKVFEVPILVFFAVCVILPTVAFFAIVRALFELFFGRDGDEKQ